MVSLFFMTGCGAMEQIADSAGDTGREIEQVVRSGSDIVEETGETAEEIKETGQKIRSLKKKKFGLELQVPRAVPDTTEIRVRPAGVNEAAYIDSGDFRSYTMSVSRYVDAATFSIYTEINGNGHSIKVLKEYRKEVDSGSTQQLVLHKYDGKWVWVPPSESATDQEIIFDP